MIAILTGIIALLIVSLFLQNKYYQNKINALNLAWENRDNALLVIIDQWQTYSSILENRLYKSDNRYGLNFAPLKASKPITLERTINDNGNKRTIEDTALVMAGMGVNGKTRPTQDKYGNIYFLLPNQAIEYVPDDEYGKYGKPEVITIETPVQTPATKGNDQNKAKDNKPTDQNKKQNNAVKTDSPAIVPDISATVISQVVSKSGKGKLTATESTNASKLIKGWQVKNMEESRMVEILCNMRKNSSLAK